MEESRKQFESWVNRRPLSKLIGFCERDGDGYVHLQHTALWESWQASRAALVVEQWDFDTFSPNDCGDDAVWMTEVKRTLGKAGITVKGEGDE